MDIVNFRKNSGGPVRRLRRTARVRISAVEWSLSYEQEAENNYNLIVPGNSIGSKRSCLEFFVMSTTASRLGSFGDKEQKY